MQKYGSKQITNDLTTLSWTIENVRGSCGGTDPQNGTSSRFSPIAQEFGKLS